MKRESKLKEDYDDDDRYLEKNILNLMDCILCFCLVYLICFPSSKFIFLQSMFYFLVSKSECSEDSSRHCNQEKKTFITEPVL